MIKINLIAEAKPGGKTPPSGGPGPKGPKAGGGLRKGDLTLLLILLLAVAAVGGFWYKLKSERDQLKRTESEKRAERDRLMVFIKKVEELEAKRTALQHKIDVINGLKAAQTGPVRVMDEVSKALPELVWLTGMTLDGSALNLIGQAMDENAVANYIANLDASPYFKEPVLVDMTRAGKDSFRFNLTCVFSPTPESTPGGEAAAAPAGT